MTTTAASISFFPKTARTEAMSLYHNLGNGKFEDVTGKPGSILRSTVSAAQRATMTTMGSPTSL